MPPLRSRKEDILPTAMSILNHLKKKHNLKVDYISHDGVQVLKDYQWPGNVRELENTLERIALIYDKSILHVDDIKNILDENESPLKKEPDSIASDSTENQKVESDDIVNLTRYFLEKFKPLKNLNIKQSERVLREQTGI